jgi:type I restriction enzyme R subunit
MALSESGPKSGQEADEEETTEDKINRTIESRKLVPNASYFAFTATPKNKTLEIFGIPYRVGDEMKHRPFHSYTMKQAIQEGFILHVLKNYTPVDSYYRLAKTIEGDPLFDVKRHARNCAAMLNRTTKPSAKRPKSWLTIFWNRSSGKTRSAVRRARWS